MVNLLYISRENISSGTYVYALYDGNKEIDPVNYSVTEQTNGFTVSVDPNYIPSLTSIIINNLPFFSENSLKFQNY